MATMRDTLYRPGKKSEPRSPKPIKVVPALPVEKAKKVRGGRTKVGVAENQRRERKPRPPRPPKPNDGAKPRDGGRKGKPGRIIHPMPPVRLTPRYGTPLPVQPILGPGRGISVPGLAPGVPGYIDTRPKIMPRRRG